MSSKGPPSPGGPERQPSQARGAGPPPPGTGVKSALGQHAPRPVLQALQRSGLLWPPRSVRPHRSLRSPGAPGLHPGTLGWGGPASVGLRTLRGTTRLRAGQNVTPGQPTGGAPGRPPSTAGSRELSRCAYPVPVGAHPRHAPGTALSRELPCAEHWMNTAHGPPQPDGGGSSSPGTCVFGRGLPEEQEAPAHADVPRARGARMGPGVLRATLCPGSRRGA